MNISENRKSRELANQRRELLQRRLATEGLFQKKGWRAASRIGESGNEFPLSPGQRRMWSIQQLNPSSVAYNVSIALDIIGPLHIPALGDALRALVRRHDILRTTYRIESDGSARQVVNENLSISYSVHDFRHLPEEEREIYVNDLARLTANTVFDLSRESPLRVQLIQTAEERNTLVVVAHHIAWDDGTSSIFFNELMEGYQNILSGNHPPGPYTKTIQFSDVAIREKNSNDAECLRGGLDYWRRQLMPLPDILDLPHLRGHAEWGNEAGNEQIYNFRKGSARRLKAIARSAGVSSFMVLFAALSALLNRYTGSRDFLVGAPVVNRDFTDSTRIMGYLGNTVALRANVERCDSFTVLIEKARKICVEAYEHQNIELDQVVKEVDPDRQRGDSGLFNVILSLRSTVVAPFEGAGLRASRRSLHNGSARFDLTLAVEVSDDEIIMEANYPLGPFADEMINQLLNHFDALLDAALNNPDAPIRSLSLLTSDERCHLILERNDTSADVPAALMPELFEKQVQRTPDNTAVVFEGSSLSYAELNFRANKLARHLIALGIGSEHVVAVAVPRSVEMVISVFGIVKAGAAYLPIDPTYPSDRVFFMLTDARPALLITTAEIVKVLPEISELTRLIVDDTATVAALEQYSTSNVRDADRVTSLHPLNLVYIIYTSGSTGIPKGVTVDHQALRNHLWWSRRMFAGLTGRTLMHSSISFDFSVTPMFGTLVCGGVLELCEDSLDAVSNTSEVVTFLKITPSHAPLLPAVKLSESGARTLLFGGEVLRGEALSQWHDIHTGALDIINEYGPTEATVACLTYSIKSKNGIPEGPIPIGRPVENVTCYVLDTELNIVPIGVPGELYIGGCQLARGYLGHRGLTSGRFMANLFMDDGSRLYRTGDVVRWSADGVLEFIGRADDQVKIRGFRIELGEIESVLAAHPSVAQAAIATRDDGPGGKYIVAYVVPTDHNEAEVSMLREHVEGMLPDYMVPAAFVVLDSLPMLPSGKIDRRALPAPNFTPQTASRNPETHVERVLCELFAEVLGLDRVGIDDSFFELGGDSIVSIQLASRARAAGVVISPRDVFEHKTVAQLVAMTSIASIEVVSESSDNGVGLVALTPIMRSFLERGEILGRHRMSVLLSVPATLNWQGLVRVLQTIVDHHDVLRSRLVSDDSGPVLEILARGSVAAESLIRRVEVTGGWNGEADEVVLAELDDAVGRLNLAAGVIVQVVWLDGGSWGGRLLMVVHHLAVDGVSWRVLTQDLATAWRADITVEQPVLQPVGTSFRRWAQGLTEAANNPSRAAELEIWRGILTDPDPVLGTSRLDMSVHTWATVRTVTLKLPVETTDAVLTTVPAAFYAGVNDVLLAGLGLAVARWRRGRGEFAPAVLVTLEGHGREEELIDGADLSRTVGWFTSQHPVRLDTDGIDLDEAFAGGPGAGTMVKRVKEHLRSLPNRGMGYGLLRYLNNQTALELEKLTEPQIGFNYLGRFNVVGKQQAQDWVLGSGGLAAAADPDMPVAVSLAVNAVTEDGPDGPELIAHWMFPQGILPGSEVHDLAEMWCTALAGLVKHAAQPGAGGHTPSDLPLVSLNQAQLDLLESRWATS